MMFTRYEVNIFLGIKGPPAKHKEEERMSIRQERNYV